MQFYYLVLSLCTCGQSLHLQYVGNHFKAVFRAKKVIVSTVAACGLVAPALGGEINNNELSVRSVLQEDIQPRIKFLRTIETEMGNYAKSIDCRDYESIRRSLRHEPTVELRRISRQLMKYLPPTKYEEFGRAYENMISTVDRLDRVGEYSCQFLP